MVQRERLEGGQGTERPLRQELEPVLVQVDGRGLAGELFGQLTQGGAVAEHAAALLLGAGAGRRAGPNTCPPCQHCLRQQAQHRDWKRKDLTVIMSCGFSSSFSFIMFFFTADIFKSQIVLAKLASWLAWLFA